MKNLLVLFITLLFFIACEKDNRSETIKKQDITLRSPAPKIDICHATNNGWNLLSVNENSWPGHAGHGDVRLDDQDNDGYVPDNECNFGLQGDCDDLDGTIYPGSNEICDDGIDNDCDGDIDENDSDCETGCVPQELEVTVNDGSVSYTLFVYPVDNEAFIRWSSTLEFIGATDNLNGLSNTNAIVNYYNGLNVIIDTYAAGLCASLSTRDCIWYLPSKIELDAMYQQLGPNGSGDMAIGNYWSSTEIDRSNAWSQNFVFGNQSPIVKMGSTERACRCVRRITNE